MHCNSKKKRTSFIYLFSLSVCWLAKTYFLYLILIIVVMRSSCRTSLCTPCVCESHLIFAYLRSAYNQQIICSHHHTNGYYNPLMNEKLRFFLPLITMVTDHNPMKPRISRFQYIVCWIHISDERALYLARGHHGNKVDNKSSLLNMSCKDGLMNEYCTCLLQLRICISHRKPKMKTP